jgi:hypothetical protein
MKRTGLVILAFVLYWPAQLARADWAAVQRLTWTPGGSYSPAMARDSGSALHVVWHDLTPDNAEIYYKRSRDGGKSWSASRRLTWTSGNSYRPAIGTDSGNTVHVVWEDYTPENFEIYYRRSTDGGTTWGPAKRLTWTSGWSEYPAIAVDSSDHVHVVWEDYTPGDYEVYYLNSSNGGETWSAPRRLTWTAGWSRNPAMAIGAGDAVHVIWQDDTPGSYEIYSKSSPDGGANWSSSRRLTWTSNGSFWPAIAGDSSDTIHVVWYGYDYTPYQLEIYYKKSPDEGATWGPTKRLTWTSGGSFWPAIGVESADTIHISWSDYTPGISEIFYKSSSDGGATWSSARRLTWNPGDSDNPVIIVDPTNTIHIVWSDDTPGNAEIYYRKGN